MLSHATGMPAPDAVLLNNMYLRTTGNSSYRLNLTDADDDLAIPAGQYFLYLASTSIFGATLDYDSAAVPPTDDSTTAVPGQVIPPGALMTLYVPTATVIHGIMNASGATGSLFLTKVR